MFLNSLIGVRNFLNKKRPVGEVKLCMTLLTRNEGDVLEKFFEFNKAMGVDCFIVHDNGSTDNTSAILKKYIEKGWIAKIFYSDGICDQVRFVNEMNEYAANKLDCNWIINSDTDEFWVSRVGSLKDELSKTQANVISFPLYSMIPLGNKGFEFESLAIVEKPKDVRTKLSIFSPNLDKVGYRLQDFISIMPGNHGVKVRRKMRVPSEDIYVLHYCVRSKEHFIKKFNQLAERYLIGGDHVAEFVRQRDLGMSDDEIYESYLDLKNLNGYLTQGYVKDCPAVKDFFTGVQKI